MTILRNEYAKRAINQIPRLLSMQDRNPYSKTYGCFDRMYWLDKAIDFPSAIMQFAVQSLALVYSEKFPNNPYYKNDNILKWAIAGMEFWTKIQKKMAKVADFFSTKISVMEKKRMLKENNIRYVFYGPKERELGQIDENIGLKKVYENESVTIYVPIYE